MPNVAATRTDYDFLLPSWNLIRDCVAGPERVKAKGKDYLPVPNATDTSPENKERYAQYKERAVFYGVTGRTLSGLSGQVFRKNPDIKLPTVLGGYSDNIDGAGVSLWQQSKRTLTDVLAYSRAGLFVDYPDTEGRVASRADIMEGRIRPTITRYEPWDIINWRTRKIGGEHKLSLVVISEQYVTDDDGFEQGFDFSWRVLRLDEEGYYLMEEWINQGTAREPDYNVRRSFTPTDASGNRLTYIPFIFIGSVNNDPDPDPPLLYDLASLNIAHYRNSADYEESVFMVGQPTPYFSGLTVDWVNDVLKGKVHLGSRAAVPLPEGGNAGLLQVNPNTLPAEAMKHKEQQMVALGAKLLDTGNTYRTATEAVIKDFGEHANLTTVSNNVSRAYETALKYMAAYVQSGEPEITFELNTDFEASRLDANEQAQLVALWQSGAIVEKEMRDALRRSGVATLSDEDFRETRDIEGPPAWAGPAGASYQEVQATQEGERMV